jgi:hypothetical protein
LVGAVVGLSFLVGLTTDGAAEQIKTQPPKPCPDGQVRDTKGNCVKRKKYDFNPSGVGLEEEGKDYGSPQ